MDMRNDTAPIRTLLVAGSEGVGELNDELADAGLEIDHARGWAEAARGAAGGGYDVVLIAAQAEEALHHMDRLHRHDALGPKLVVVCADAPEPSALAALEAGAADVLSGSEATSRSIQRAVRYAGETRRLESRLADIALFDRLTGLPSHVLFWQFLNHAVERAKRYNQQLAVMSLYVEGLAELNSQGGWALGNHVLGIVSERLHDTLRASDTVARFAGPKFTLLLESVREDADAQLIAHRILDVLSGPISLDGQTARLSATIGVALYPTSGGNAHELLEQSLGAMDRAKDQGSGGIHFA